MKELMQSILMNMNPARFRGKHPVPPGCRLSVSCLQILAVPAGGTGPTPALV